MGALAGRSTGADFKPTRKTPSHVWAQEQGATFVEVGQWPCARSISRKRVRTHWRQNRGPEVNATRNGVGHLRRDDAWQNRRAGRGCGSLPEPHIIATPLRSWLLAAWRYGLMLREDGIAMD